METTTVAFEKEESKITEMHPPLDEVREMLKSEVEPTEQKPPLSEEDWERMAEYFTALGGSMPDLEIPRRRRVEDY